jgi:hypothetical protein
MRRRTTTSTKEASVEAAGERAVVYESIFTGERLEVDLPLVCRFDLNAVRDELRLPSYVDPSEPSVGRAVALLWAASGEPSPLDEHQLRPAGKAVQVAVFGGVGFRFLCPSANGAGPFARPLGDLDVLTTRADAHRLLETFSRLEGIYGSRMWHAITKADERFNSMRRGQRFRLHALRDQPAAPNGIEAYPVDVFADALSFCHTVPATAAFADPRRHLYTVGAAEMLLTKLQYIRAVPLGAPRTRICWTCALCSLIVVSGAARDRLILSECTQCWQRIGGSRARSRTTFKIAGRSS